MTITKSNAPEAGKLLYEALCVQVKKTWKIYGKLLTASDSNGICNTRAKIIFNHTEKLKKYMTAILESRMVDEIKSRLETKERAKASWETLMAKEKQARLEVLLCERDEQIRHRDKEIARLTGLLRKRDNSLHELSSALSGLNTAMCGYLGE